MTGASRHSRPDRQRPHGFSLLELLVVIGVIAVLIGVLLPALSRAREMGRRTACLSNLHVLGQSLFVYANANRDRLPNQNAAQKYIDYDGANAAMVEFNADCVKQPRVFWCPSNTKPVPGAIVTADPTLPDSARVSYDFYFLYWPPELGPVLSKLGGQAPLAWDIDGGEASSPLQNHGSHGGNVVFSDGHGAWQPSAKWDGDNWPNPANQYYPAE